MSVKRAMREIDSREFAEWMAYSSLEPFGPEREDQRAGMVAALIANVNRDSAKRPEPYDVEDFFPRYDTAEKRAAEATIKEAPDLNSKLMTWAAAMADKKPGKSEMRPKRKE